jgi:hypothetical protein
MALPEVSINPKRFIAALPFDAASRCELDANDES